MLHLPRNPRMLHPLTGLPVEAVGCRKDGRLIWPILGGDDTVEPDPAAGDQGEPPAGAPVEPADPPGADALGDAGKRALDTMKSERNQARDETRALRAEFDEFKAKAEGKEAEHAAAQEAQRIKDEALAAANGRILKAEMRAAAAGKLADPADALLYIDLSSFEVDDDGAVDGAAIAAAVEDLVKTKPYLAAQGGGRFQGSADGGVRNGTAAPTQLSETDVKRLYAEKKYDEIAKAQAEGRLTNLLGA